MKRRRWLLFSNHGIVLVYIAKYPQSTTPEIAKDTLLSVWGVQRIIADLEKDGYIGKIKNGRCNRYTIYPQVHLRHRIMRNYTVGEVLQAIGYKPKHVKEISAESKDKVQNNDGVKVK
jgi:predicted transcriptional regulator